MLTDSANSAPTMMHQARGAEMVHDLAPVLAAIRYDRDFDINGTLRQVVKRCRRQASSSAAFFRRPGFAQTNAALSSISSTSGPVELNASHKIAAANLAVASSTRAV